MIRIVNRPGILGFLYCAIAWAVTAQVHAAIISATHTGTGTSGTPTIVNGTYGIGTVPISDRTHIIRQGTFDTTTNNISGVSSPTPPNTVALSFPTYLVGNDYVTVNQGNRSNSTDYELTITTDVPSDVYMLLDTRLGDDPAFPSQILDEPGLQQPFHAWIAVNGWTRVNTGLTPNGAGDYVGIDENNNGTLDTYYAVYHNVTGPGNVIKTFTQGESRNMYSVSVRPIPEPASLAMLIMVTSLDACWRHRRKA